jgi:hypothetical protein
LKARTPEASGAGTSSSPPSTDTDADVISGILVAVDGRLNLWLAIVFTIPTSDRNAWPGSLGAGIMRRRNWRVFFVGLVLILAAAAFFLGMGTTAPRSNDPVALMQIVGEVSGAVAGLGLVMMLVGWIGKKAA